MKIFFTTIKELCYLVLLNVMFTGLQLVVQGFSEEISYFVNIYETALTEALLQSCQKCYPCTRAVIFTSAMTSGRLCILTEH